MELLCPVERGGGHAHLAGRRGIPHLRQDLEAEHIVHVRSFDLHVHVCE